MRISFFLLRLGIHDGGDSAGGGGPKQRRIMELNSDHPIVARLYDRFKTNGEDPVVGDSIELLFELALVTEGSEIADPVRLNQLTLDLLQKAV